MFSAAVKQAYFLFGTDNVGRDLLTRTLVAGRISLAIGLLAGLVAVVIGVVYGAAAGFIGGRTDEVMMRIVDVLYSLPFIFFVIMLVVFFGRNFVLMFLAVGAVLWLDMARIVRGQALSIKRQEYVQAAEALGVSQAGILLRHVVPNLLGPVVIYMTLLVPQVIILESFLSFLGLGVQEPMSSWGVLISQGAKNIPGANWLLVFGAEAGASAGFGGTLLLVGGLTDVCIHYTAADAHQHDYAVRVLTDCVAGSSERAHAATLEAIEYLQRDALVTAADVHDWLDRREMADV